jgi:hypothetical protein
MGLHPSAEEGSTKRELLEERERKWEDTVASQKYTPVFARAGSNNISLFFY